MASKGPINRKDDLVIQEADGELLIYDLRDNRALCLNETSALVWQACDGTRDVGELRRHVSTKLKASASDDLIWLALDQLKKENLLAPESTIENNFRGISRRDVIRRIGIGSAVALPLIAGILAPPAYAQSSVCGTTCKCNNAQNWAAGAVCVTAGSGQACPGTPAGCTVCRSISGGSNSQGNCFTA